MQYKYSAEKSSLKVIFIFILFSLLFLISPYYRGLYFESNMYYVEILIFGLFILVNLLLESKKENIDGQYISLIILLIPSFYIVSFFNAASPLMALQLVFRYLSYSFVFIIATKLFNKANWSNKAMQASIVIATGWLTYFVWMNAWGQAEFKDAILSNRFSSVFQYPNTYGALLIGLIIASLILTIRNHWGWVTLGSIFLIPIQVAFIMTYSRGSWLIFPVIYLIILITLNWKKQIHFLLNTLVSFIISLLAYPKLTVTIKDIDAMLGWKLLVSYSLLTIIIYLVIHFGFKKLINHELEDKLSWTQLIIPVILVTIALVGLNSILTNDELVNKLPESIGKRISSISLESGSFVARNDFNEDALKIYKDHVLIGTGGGGWKALFQKYQDYSYWSTQSHNFYSQLLVEIGTIGSLIFLIVFVYFLFASFVKYRNGGQDGRLTQSYWLAIFLALIFHSLIDFDMSFGYIGITLFLSLAGIYVPKENEPNQDKAKGNVTQENSKTNSNKKLLNFAKIYSVIKWTSIIVAGISIVIVYRFIVAQDSYNTLQSKKLTGNQMYQNAKKAVSLNPFEVNYRLSYADILYRAGKQNNNQSLLDLSKVQLDKAIKLEPYNPILQYRASSLSFKQGNPEQGIMLLEQAIENGRWTIELYEKYIQYAKQYGTQLNDNGHAEEANKIWRKALAYYEQVQDQIQYQQDYAKDRSKRQFRINIQMKLDIGEIHVKMNNMDQAIFILNEVLKSKDEKSKVIAAQWLVVAYEKLGNQDEALRIKNKYLKEK